MVDCGAERCEPEDDGGLGLSLGQRQISTRQRLTFISVSGERQLAEQLDDVAVGLDAVVRTDGGGALGTLAELFDSAKDAGVGTELAAHRRNPKCLAGKLVGKIKTKKHKYL